MIKSFVAAGLGVSLISASFARDQVLAERVKLIPLQGVELWRELGLAYRRDRTHTRPTTTFIRYGQTAFDSRKVRFNRRRLEEKGTAGVPFVIKCGT